MAHKALIGIVGPSGSGKSTSLRNLDPETTRIIDLERKGFPFRGIDKFKVMDASSIAECEQHFKACLDDKTVKVIVLESLTKYFELLLRFSQTNFKGYDIYSYYNKTIGNFLDKVKNDHSVIIFTAIDEIVKIPSPDGSESAARRIKVGGREWEGKVEKELLMVLFTTVRKDKDGKMLYLFETNSDGIISAKTPLEMFPERLVGNDMAEVIKTAENYYTNGK